MTPEHHAKNEKIAQARADFDSLLLRVFDNADGQRVLDWLHAAAATRKPAFVPGDRDPYAAASRDGRKSIVWEIEANLESARAAAKRGSAGKPEATGRARARKQGG